jgi:hypothetical protein
MLLRKLSAIWNGLCIAIIEADGKKKMNSIISRNASNVPGKIKPARGLNCTCSERGISHGDGCRKFAGASFHGFRCSVGEQFDRSVLPRVPWHRPASLVAN